MTDAAIWAQFYAAVMTAADTIRSTDRGARLADDMLKEYQKRFDKRGTTMTSSGLVR